MNNFQKRGGYRPGGFNKDRGGDRGFGAPKEMYDATCANCSKATQVPFRPNGKKPVYCRDCFQRDDSRDAGPRRDFAPRRDFNDRPRRAEFPAPAAPSDGKAIAELRKQVLEVSAKLDYLVQILEASRQSEELSAALSSVTPEAKKKPAKKAKASKKK